MDPLSTFCLIFLGVYVLISVIRIIVWKIKGSDKKTYYKFTITDCNSNKTEFAVRAHNIKEAMDTVRDLIEVTCEDKWIEFPVSEKRNKEKSND